MCRVFEVSRSGYYEWLERPASKRAQDNQLLKERIHDHFHKSRQTYGTPRLKDALKKEGWQVSPRRIGRLMKEQGLVYLSPFDHDDVVCGQGTIGLELVEDWQELDTVVVPLSGGGLMAGIAAAVKSQKPETRLIGVTMERGPAMHESIRAGHPVEVVEEPTLADSLGGGIGLDNRRTFAMCRDLVDETVLVSEAAIAAGMRALYRDQQIVAEGGGAVGVAALIAGKISAKGRRIAVVISGRNVDMDIFTRIAAGENVDLTAKPA